MSGHGFSSLCAPALLSHTTAAAKQPKLKALKMTKTHAFSLWYSAFCPSASVSIL